MSFYIPDIIEKEQLRAIRESFMPGAEKENQIKTVQKSFLTKQTSSLRTIINCTNSLIGSATLVLPLYFLKTGLITSVIFAIIVGVFNFLTVRLILKHYNRGESDFSDMIKRILGNRAYKGYSVVTFSLSYVGVIASFLLIASVLYSTMNAFIPNLSPKSKIDFSGLSYQWTGVGLAAFLFLLYNIRRMSILLKISSYGIYCVGTYICFVIFIGIISALNGEVSFDQSSGGIPMTNFEFDKVTTLVGLYAMAYLSHPTIIAIAKYNKEFENTTRDVGVAYSAAGLVYIVLGIMGSLAINARPLCKPGTHPSTIMDCFSDAKGLLKYMSFVAQFAVIVQLTSIVPIINFVGRQLFFGLLYHEDQKVPTWQFMTFNLFTACSQLVIQIFNTDPSMVIAFSGTVCGFVIVYIFPIMIHFRRIKSSGSERESFLTDESQEYLETEMIGKRTGTSTVMSLRDFKDGSNQIGWRRWLLYGFLTLYGLALGVITIHNVIRSTK